MDLDLGKGVRDDSDRASRSRAIIDPGLLLVRGVRRAYI